MNSGMRWILIASVLGLCSAYALWSNTPRKLEKNIEPPDAASLATLEEAAKSVTPEKPAPESLKVPAAPAPVAIQKAPEAPTLVPEKKGPAVSALVFDPKAADFGELLVNETKDIKVAVRNTSDKKISIKQRYGSCGCLKVDMAAESIEPQKSAEMTLRFTGLPGKRPDKYFAKLVTDETGSPTATLPVSGKAKQVFLVEPLTLYFDQVAKGQSKTMEARIKQMDGQPFAIKNIAASHKEYAFTWEPLKESNGSEYRIMATATGLRAGALTEGAVILTDHPKVPVVALHLGMRVLGDVISTMPSLTGTQEAEGRLSFLETTIKRMTPGELVIENVTEAGGVPIEFKLKPVDASTCQVAFHFKAPFSADKTGEFLIKTNAEPEPMRLPYRIIMRGPQHRKFIAPAQNPPKP